MESCLSVLQYLLCIGSMMGLLGVVFSYERRQKQALFFVVLGLGAVLTGLSNLLFAGEIGELLSELLLLVSAAGLPYLYFRPQKKATFFWIGLMLCSMVDFLEYRIVSSFPTVTPQRTMMAYSVIYAVCCAAIWLVGKLTKGAKISDFPERIPAFLYVVIFVADYSAYYGMTMRHNPDYSTVVADGLHFVSAALSACCIGYMIYRYVVLTNLRKEDERMHALELQRYEEMIQNNRDVRAFRHDYKNNLFALETFIESGRTAEAQEFIQSMTDSLERTKGRFTTGNILADAILSDKAAKAEELGIKVDYDGVIPSTGISNRDLCAILSNAMDNAIEACRAQAPCTITVRSNVKVSGMVLAVSNPVTEQVLIRNGVVQTSKADKQNHGFGIANIRKAAKNYNGYADISSDANTFTIEVGLMLNNAKIG